MAADRAIVPIVPIVPANDRDALSIADRVWLGLPLSDEDQRAIDDAAGIDADWDEDGAPFKGGFVALDREQWDQRV
ncbi:hypothetical protein ACFO0A_00700 [Novosphingobium tardum]|uniref:Uncharacterized protein n=1 Tax=Novosphingobium tardum TaxID=1538021 RepID=A0ABV8RKZ1_9SPHN